MRSFGNRCCILGLLGIVLFSSGCNLAALCYFLVPGMDSTFEPPCKLVGADKDKEVRVVFLVSTGLETRPEFIRVDRELSRLVNAQLTEAFKKNKEKVMLVPVSLVEKYKDEHPNWRSTPPDEIGKYFNADKVVSLEVDSLSLYEKGSSNMLYHGVAEVSISVIDMSKAADGPVYNDEYRTEFPKTRGHIPASDSSVSAFRQKFLSIVARDLAWKFTAHPTEDAFKMQD